MFVGIFRGIMVTQLLFRWCEIDFVHPQYHSVSVKELSYSGVNIACFSGVSQDFRKNVGRESGIPHPAPKEFSDLDLTSDLVAKP